MLSPRANVAASQLFVYVTVKTFRTGSPASLTPRSTMFIPPGARLGSRAEMLVYLNSAALSRS